MSKEQLPKIESGYIDCFSYHLIGSKLDKYESLPWNSGFTDTTGHDYQTWLQEHSITPSQDRTLVTWIRLYKKARFTITHPEELKVTDFTTGEPVQCVEYLEGRNIPIADTLYAVGVLDNDRYEFQTAAEILAKDKLSEHTKRWMGLISLGNYGSRDIDQFLPLMPGSPSTSYELAKQTREKLAYPDPNF